MGIAVLQMLFLDLQYPTVSLYLFFSITWLIDV